MTATINVKGMTCNGCVASVTSAIKRVPGVRSVIVTLEEKKATVEFDEHQTDVKAIEAAIADAGYEPAGEIR
jgi:copper ion binding protein